jgi:hypothetical protein
VTLRQVASEPGTDRVTLIWPDNAIQEEWLQVTVLADTNTGLAANDVFCFGNAIGESGNSTANAIVNSTDDVGARQNPRTPLNRAPIYNAYDYNRDSLVNSSDQVIPRLYATTPVSALKLITMPISGFAQVFASVPLTSPATSDTTVVPMAAGTSATSSTSTTALVSSADDPGQLVPSASPPVDALSNTSEKVPLTVPAGDSTGKGNPLPSSGITIFPDARMPKASPATGSVVPMAETNSAPSPAASAAVDSWRWARPFSPIHLDLLTPTRSLAKTALQSMSLEPAAKKLSPTWHKAWENRLTLRRPAPLHAFSWPSGHGMWLFEPGKY